MPTRKPSGAPLIARPQDDHFASCPSEQGLNIISCSRLLAEAAQLVSGFGQYSNILNLCQSRYNFSRSFIASIMHGSCTLLPQNHSVGTQNTLIEDYPKTLIVHDGLEGISDLTEAMNVKGVFSSEVFKGDIPEIELDQLVAIAFTSGSTGKPKPNKKYWRTFVESSAINAAHMLDGISDTLEQHMVATVPAQHMWGLETSVLLPMFKRICVHDARPLFPQDIANMLAKLPEPRILVSTPVHLRALIASGIELPKTAHILCATAPLHAELAKKAEQRFLGRVVEVYGCSEVGSMASREPVKANHWRAFSGLDFNKSEERYEVSAAHLPAPAIIHDKIAFRSGREFELLGRDEDMLEIAGKRGSLQAMNHLLLSLEGVVDAVVFVPSEQKRQIKRTAALVVADKRQTTEAIARSLHLHLDPVFIPRPIKFVDSLPRETNGKLPAARLQEFFQSLKDQ